MIAESHHHSFLRCGHSNCMAHRLRYPEAPQPSHGACCSRNLQNLATLPVCVCVRVSCWTEHRKLALARFAPASETSLPEPRENLICMQLESWLKLQARPRSLIYMFPLLQGDGGALNSQQNKSRTNCDKKLRLQ